MRYRKVLWRAKAWRKCVCWCVRVCVCVCVCVCLSSVSAGEKFWSKHKSALTQSLRTYSDLDTKVGSHETVCFTMQKLNGLHQWQFNWACRPFDPSRHAYTSKTPGFVNQDYVCTYVHTCMHSVDIKMHRHAGSGHTRHRHQYWNRLAALELQLKLTSVRCRDHTGHDFSRAKSPRSSQQNYDGSWTEALLWLLSPYTIPYVPGHYYITWIYTSWHAQLPTLCLCTVWYVRPSRKLQCIYTVYLGSMLRTYMEPYHYHKRFANCKVDRTGCGDSWQLGNHKMTPN